MTLPFALGSLPLPDWMPWWLAVLLLLCIAVYGLLALSVPFVTFGLRGRMEALDARLDEVQDDIRALTLRLAADRESPAAAPRPLVGERLAEERARPAPPLPPARPVRSEPRVAWPRDPDS